MTETMTTAAGRSPRAVTVAAVIAFAAFGAYWGVWGASVPRVQDQAGVTDGQLGVALLFVGAGALPAMLLVGRALDRWGLRVAAAVIVALGALGSGLALAAHDLLTLSVGLAVVGAASGAADVAMNAVAGRAETLAGRPVITRCHGVFSSLVVASSLGSGVAAAAHLPLAVPFLAVTAISVLAGAAMLRALPPTTTTAPTRADTPPPTHDPLAHDPLVPPATPRPADPARSAGAAEGSGRVSTVDGGGSRVAVVGLVALGVLGALAFASENAHQSWAAVFARDELRAGPGLAAVAPAVFAGTVAVTRFAAGGLGAGRARLVLLAGALAAGGGALVIAVAPVLAVAAVGLVLAGVGTAVLFPTLVGIVSRTVAESHRGRATSIVTTVSYLGFLLGPVYVGACADAFGLRGAMVAVAALAAALFALAPVLLRVSGRGAAAPRTGEVSVAVPVGRE
jgi:MFS family permease